ncbi:protease inhibitor I42 family protein [Lutimonas sp.]|uniref:protease inhibitor I42 family protein n=1 Tax=Lutimonas sp. TaxID=1872403 RepID=UPI003D9BF322
MKHMVILSICSLLLLSFQSSVVNVRTGEVFKVVLASNQSTGYSWQWENKSEENLLDSVYVDYVLKDKAITGAGGNEIWEFMAKRKGKQEVIMVYKRPWEKTTEADRKVFLIHID